MRDLDPKRVKWMRIRIGFLASLLLLGGLVVARRAYKLQIQQGAELREMAEDQYLRDVRLSPRRGTIYDRSGAELAVSVDVESIWANPRELRARGGDPALVAQRIAGAIGGDAAALARKFASDRFFVWVERRVTPHQARLVRELHIPGIGLSKEARRYYPNRELASHVLGFANLDGVGVEGIEKSYEDRLRGSVSAVPAIRDRRGAVVFSEQLLDDRAAQGDDLVLTIDKTIQSVAEHELAMAIQTTEARAGSVVVLDPQTGEIYAMANYPTFNPNEPGASAAGDRRNRAVTDRYEPGSTIKPFTVAGAIGAGVVRPEDIIDCQNGSMRVAEYTIHDSHPWSLLTPAQILARSSNIGTAKIGASLGRAGLYRTLRGFGFGETTGISLPSETAGILRNYRRWYDMDAATISFGQGMSVTTMQLALATGALVNGGRLLEPMLVRRVLDGRGEVVEESHPRERRQVVSARTARLVADMLVAVTGPGGTGTEAAIDGYVVGGKTGTAQKADYVSGGYARDQWMSSFVGFVPAQRPRLVIAVVIDEPIIEHYGGLVAGPVFRRVGEASLRHLGIPADHSGQAVAQHREAQREARRTEVALGCTGAACATEGATITESRDPLEGETRVPSLVGMTARRAMRTLSAQHLLAGIEGTGVVTEQVPSAGAIVARGTRIELVLGTANAVTAMRETEGATLARAEVPR